MTYFGPPDKALMDRGARRERSGNRNFNVNLRNVADQEIMSSERRQPRDTEPVCGTELARDV